MKNFTIYILAFLSVFSGVKVFAQDIYTETARKNYTHTVEYAPPGNSEGCFYTLSVNSSVAITRLGIRVEYEAPKIIKVNAIRYRGKTYSAQDLPASIFTHYKNGILNQNNFDFDIYTLKNQQTGSIFWYTLFNEVYPESTAGREAMYERGLKLLEQNAFKPQNVRICSVCVISFNSTELANYFINKNKVGTAAGAKTETTSTSTAATSPSGKGSQKETLKNQPKTTSNTSTTQSQTSKIQQQNERAEELRKATELANQQINANRLANETRQKQIEQSVNTAVDGVSQLATGIYSNIAAENERKEENERIDREQRQQRRLKGKILLDNFLKLANNGDETAIKYSIEGFILSGEPISYYNGILDDYFSNEPKEYLTFLENVQEKYNSTNAKNALIEHYKTVTDNFKWVASIHRRKAIAHTIFGGVIAAAGLYGGELIYEGESQKADENNEAGEYTLSSVVQTVGILGGACYVVSGLVHLVRIGQANNDEHNTKAKTKLSYYLNSNSVSVNPTYNFQNKNFGLAINIKF